jgi:hypothetical protein
MNMPIWFCLVKTEQLLPTSYIGYRIVKAVPAELSDLNALYKQYEDDLRFTPGLLTMLFTREPDKTPMTEQQAAGVTDAT